jgi:hypothetical protein
MAEVVAVIQRAAAVAPRKARQFVKTPGNRDAWAAALLPRNRTPKGQRGLLWRGFLTA